MASVNKVILVGNLGRDPEVRFMPNGEAVCNFSIATTDSWKDKSGAKQERTEWHNIVMYRKLAEIAGEYLKKGRPVYVEGRLQTRKWQTKEGQDRYTTEIIADQMAGVMVQAQMLAMTAVWIKVVAAAITTKRHQTLINRLQNQHQPNQPQKRWLVVQALMILKMTFRSNQYVF